QAVRLQPDECTGETLEGAFHRRGRKRCGECQAGSRPPHTGDSAVARKDFECGEVGQLRENFRKRRTEGSRCGAWHIRDEGGRSQRGFGRPEVFPRHHLDGCRRGRRTHSQPAADVLLPSAARVVSSGSRLRRMSSSLQNCPLPCAPQTSARRDCRVQKTPLLSSNFRRSRRSEGSPRRAHRRRRARRRKRRRGRSGGGKRLATETYVWSDEEVKRVFEVLRMHRESRKKEQRGPGKRMRGVAADAVLSGGEKPEHTAREPDRDDGRDGEREGEQDQEEGEERRCSDKTVPGLLEGEADEQLSLPGVTLQRFKGLGEMQPEQLRRTTMSPVTRILKKISVADAEAAEAAVASLMGDDVDARKKIIFEANRDVFVEELDV
ncbi:DNA gyrase subunit B, partial [Toxoplasma gondii GAB2-2007-GAL-DOM2]